MFFNRQIFVNFSPGAKTLPSGIVISPTNCAQLQGITGVGASVGVTGVDVRVGRGVDVGRGVWVGRGVAVGSAVFVGRGVLLACGRINVGSMVVGMITTASGGISSFRKRI